MILQTIDSGATSWILSAICLVLIMTPGLALFYGGLLRKKNVLSMFGYCFISIVLTSIAWFFISYSLIFGSTIVGVIGNPLQYFGLFGLSDKTVAGGTVPMTVFVIYQCMFAIITAAILASPFADRGKFSSFCVFIFIWVIIVYSPIAHWVWGEGGWLAALGFLDYAGGTVVHLNVGMSALAVALVIGRRKGHLEEDMPPHNIPMVLAGMGLLWFGWFGFNGGSGLAADTWAGLAILNTNLSACSAAVAWIILESREKESGGKPSMIGIATGALVGLIGITPSADFVEPVFAFLIGIITTIPVYFVIRWRSKSKLDESLDAFSCHGVGGFIGVMLTGIFSSLNGSSSLITGNFTQFGIQILGCVLIGAFSFGITFALSLLIKKLMGLRVPAKEEEIGLDQSSHGEIAYIP
ncbi:MAG: ammonium transporter [Candidatus Hodarchaeota archaeon]